MVVVVAAAVVGVSLQATVLHLGASLAQRAAPLAPQLLCTRTHSFLPPVSISFPARRLFPLSITTMSASPSEKAAPPTDEFPRNGETGNLAAGILPHILNLYNCNATAADYEIYDPKATFEDPLMRAEGVKQIKSAFYSIPKVFKEAKMIEYTVTEEESAPSSGEIKIDNLQRYKIVGKTIDMVSLISLQVENGKVVRHVDMWNKKPLLDRNTIQVPLVGRLVEKLRRGNMLVTHLFMGCGKDPTPHS